MDSNHSFHKHHLKRQGLTIPQARLPMATELDFQYMYYVEKYHTIATYFHLNFGPMYYEGNNLYWTPWGRIYMRW